MKADPSHPPANPPRRRRKLKAGPPPAQPALPPPPAAPAFTPVPLRPRHDGWTPERQVAFIRALGESGCVAEARAAAGMSEGSAYRLRARAGAISFRNAWDAALDYAVRRLSDRAFARAMNGVAVPVFYQGERIGERVHYDERLTMFLLRYRDPLRYGQWRDKQEISGHAEHDAARFESGVAKTYADAALPPEAQAAAYARLVRELARELAVARGEDPDDAVPDPDAAKDLDDDEYREEEADGGDSEGDVA